MHCDWLRNWTDSASSETGKETFELVSFTCTPWCPNSQPWYISITVIHVLIHYIQLSTTYFTWLIPDNYSKAFQISLI